MSAWPGLGALMRLAWTLACCVRIRCLGGASFFNRGARRTRDAAFGCIAEVSKWRCFVPASMSKSTCTRRVRSATSSQLECPIPQFVRVVPEARPSQVRRDADDVTNQIAANGNRRSLVKENAHHYRTKLDRTALDRTMWARQGWADRRWGAYQGCARRTRSPTEPASDQARGTTP